jgi:hypothetical protein
MIFYFCLYIKVIHHNTKVYSKQGQQTKSLKNNTSSSKTNNHKRMIQIHNKVRIYNETTIETVKPN